MDAGGRQAEEHVAFFDALARDDFRLLDDADGEAGDVVLADRVEAAHLSGLAANEAQPDSLQAFATPLTTDATCSGSSLPTAR